MTQETEYKGKRMRILLHFPLRMNMFTSKHLFKSVVYKRMPRRMKKSFKNNVLKIESTNRFQGKIINFSNE